MLLGYQPPVFRTCPVVQMEELAAMQKTWVRSLGWEGTLERLPTPVFWPGESRGQRSLAGYSPWGHRVGHD